MSTYTINCSWEMFGHVDVEADSLDEAMDKLKDEMKLSDINSEYVSDSFKIDDSSIYNYIDGRIRGMK